MKKRIFTRLISLLLLLSLCLLPGAAGADGDGYMPIVGEWLWASTIYNAGLGGAEKIISRSAEMGVTDIYLLVKGTAGKEAYLKGNVPLARSYRNRDVLQEAIDAAHAHGLRLHAWITSIEDSSYKSAHPEAGLYHYKNGRTNDRIHPADAGFNAYMQQLVHELVTLYPVDGLHFDYIRYNHVANGWGPEDLERMAAMGADVERLQKMIDTTYYAAQPKGAHFFDQYAAGDPDAGIFVQYRRENVVGFARGIIDAARSARPDIIISAALMPDGALDPAFQLVHYAQDYGDAAALYDYVIPMAYSKDYGKNAAWVAQVVKACAEKGNQVVAGLQAYAPSTSKDLMTEVEAIRALTEDPAYAGKVLGVAHFRTSQYSYARLTYTQGENALYIRLCNAIGEGAMTKVEITLQDGLQALSVQLLSGFDKNAGLEISPDGSKVTLSRNVLHLLSKNAVGELLITFAGQADPAQPVALVQPYLGSASRTYHVYDVIAQ